MQDKYIENRNVKKVLVVSQETNHQLTSEAKRNGKSQNDYVCSVLDGWCNRYDRGKRVDFFASRPPKGYHIPKGSPAALTVRKSIYITPTLATRLELIRRQEGVSLNRLCLCFLLQNLGNRGKCIKPERPERPLYVPPVDTLKPKWDVPIQAGGDSVRFESSEPATPVHQIDVPAASLPFTAMDTPTPTPKRRGSQYLQSILDGVGWKRKEDEAEPKTDKPVMDSDGGLGTYEGYQVVSLDSVFR